MVFVERFIKNINEPRVSISGTVVSVDENGFVLDDKTGQIVVFSNKKVEQGRYVRVFGNYLGEGVKAEVIQDLSSVDKELHRKIIEKMQ
jgi:RNase P/RNase MRP subunit p29